MPKLSLKRKKPNEEAAQNQAEAYVEAEPKIEQAATQPNPEEAAAGANVEPQPPQLPRAPVESEEKQGKLSRGKKKEKQKKEPKKAPLQVIKGTSSFVKRQTRKYLSLTGICIAVFCVVLVSFLVRAILLFSLDILEIAGLLSCIAPVALSYFFMHKYKIYRGGFEGEKEVVSQLQKNLDGNYTLINSLYLNDAGGDIDHILLAPNGVFVLETKNWKGKISCKGDVWLRVGMPDMGSPSRQVRRNAGKIKRIIDLSPDLRDSDVYVEGIVVFTNSKATLDLKYPTVTVVKAQNLTNYVTNLQNNRTYTKDQLDTIRKELFDPNIKRVLRRNL